jgi:hypothetical protein
LDGGPQRAIPNLLPGDMFSWSSDPHVLYVYHKGSPVRVYRLNILTGERQLFKELHPADATGLCDVSHVLISADGRAYVYSYIRLLSELYMVKGLK